MIFAEKYRILLHHIFQLRPRAPDSALRERQDPRLGAGFDARARDHRAPRACAGRSGLSADAWEFDGFACAAAQRKLVVGARGLAVVVAQTRGWRARSCSGCSPIGKGESYAEHNST